MKLIFDAPVGTHDPLKRLGVGLVWWEAGDDGDGLASEFPGAAHVAIKQGNLLGAGPVYAFGVGDRERAFFEAVAVAACFAGDARRGVGLKRGVDRIDEGGLVVLGGENVGPPFSTIVLQTSRWVCRASPVTMVSWRGSR
jgi:hypothetical protein